MNEKKKILKFKKPEEDNKTQKLNLTTKNQKKRTNFSKLKFNKNLLIEILKKTQLRKIIEKKNKAKNNNTSKITDFNNTDKPLNSNDKTNKVYHNIHKFPEMKKFHNITADKIVDLIFSEDKTEKSAKSPNLKYSNLKLKLKTEENEDEALKNKINYVKSKNKQLKFQNISNNEQKKENNKYPKYTNNIKYINISDLNLNKENILPYLSTRLNEHSHYNRYNSLSKPKKKETTDNVNTKSKKLFMNKTSTNYATNRWLESIRDSIKRYDVLHRRSRIDRLIFTIENPEGCFEENLFEGRPGDKYILLKYQMVKHKDKFENIIRDIKLNQKKSEHLMKKYIYDLLSRKKDVY